MSDHAITIILDTNVFVAAYWAPSSASARLIRACIDGFARALYTDEIKSEVMHILGLIKVSSDYMEWVEEFWSIAENVEPVVVDSVRTKDPDDQKFLEAAVGGDADFIVTNDDHLLSVNYIGRTEILTPRSAARVLRLH